MWCVNHPIAVVLEILAPEFGYIFPTLNTQDQYLTSHINPTSMCYHIMRMEFAAESRVFDARPAIECLDDCFYPSQDAPSRLVEVERSSCAH